MILEWKKEWLKKKTWILLAIVIGLSVGISVLIHMQEVRSKEIEKYNYTHNIELLQGFIKEKEELLENDATNKAVQTALEEDKKRLNLYKRGLEALESGDWKKELKLKMEQIEQNLDAYREGRFVGESEESLTKTKEKYEYLYENDIKPQLSYGTVNGWNTLYLFLTGEFIPNLMPLLFVLFCIDMMSVEYDYKTMKLLLVQPISRKTILMRKLFAAIVHTIVCSMIIFASVFIAGCVMGGTGDWRYPIDAVLLFGEQKSIITLKDYFQQSLPLWLFSSMFFVSFALLISTICSNSAMATMIGIVAVEGGFAVAKIGQDSPLIYQPFYLGNIGQLFTMKNPPNGWITIATLFISTLCCVGITWKRLKRKDFYL
ncbi:MAG: ABC transporter permease subunit [Clostridiales bacterium]|nr:ABC transporter permease subunit [Clostridiales bacterium]